MGEINLNIRQKKVVQARDSRILCLASAASGKALPNSTRIPTTEGWKEVGNIKPGDYLFDRYGKPTKVLQIFPQGELEVYQLTLGDGRVALCSKDHIWSVNKTTWKNKNSFREYTCEELLKEELIDSNRRAKFYIPCSSATELPEQKYKISPYIIGAFLGDGCCTEHQLTFSSADEEIVNKIASLLGDDIVSFKRHEDNYSWGFYHLDKNRTKVYTNILPKEIINYSYDKSIPDEYKRGSIEQRLELLQGLFDTDGSITKDKRGDHAATATVRFTSTSLKLTEDVKEILGSLGYISTISIDERKDKYTTGICYNLSVNMPNSDKYKLFSLQRKRDIALSVKDKKQQKRYDRTSIREIKSLEYKEEMTCFLVDNEEHLFLMNDFIVTHNTRTLTERIRYILEQGWCKPEDIVAITFTNQASAEMYARLGKLGEKTFIGTIHSYANKLCIFNGLDTQQYIREEKFDKIIERAMTIPRDKLKTISYLFVDECQDLGDLEFKFLTYLRKDNEFWCGDERQAIYGFKGSTDKYLREMYEDPTYAKYFLVENYRNTPEIVDFAEGFLNGTEPLSPRSIPKKTKNGFIEKCRFPDALEELEASGNWGSWFIIARTNRDVYSIMEQLKEKEIPNATFKRSELSIEEMENLMAENTVKVMSIHQCVSGNTLIPTSEGIIPISEIVERKDKNLLIYNGSYYDRVKEFIDNGMEKTYKITSKCGNSIRITKNHDCVVLRENGLQKIPAKELKIGDNILIRKDIENYQYKDIILTPTTKENVNHNTVIYDTPKILDTNLAELIGMITADGTHNKLSIHYIKRHKECVDRFAELIKLCFNKEIIVKKSNDSNSWFAECNSTFIIDFLYKNFDGINNNDKFISSQILQANSEIQCAFLRGLFEDGAVQLKNGKVDNITLTFKNPKMLIQLQTLLFALGIDASFTTRVYNNKALNYCYIYSTGMTVYKEKIGFISELKQNRLNTFEQKYQRKNKSSAFREMLLKEKENLFITGYSRFWNNLKKNKSLTDGGFFDYYKLLNDEQKENPTVQLIKTVFEDYQIEEIVSIEEHESEPTYCLTMEHEPQFIQNGFLMGNSKGLESPNVIVVGALTYNKEERRIAYVAATRAETNLWWCPALKKDEGKLKEPTRNFKVNRKIERAYGELIEF